MIKLGQEVKDRVSGFQGIAVARTEYLQGCARILIQPKVKTKDMTLPDCKQFDEPDVVVLGPGVSKPEKPEKKEPEKKTGGPHDHDASSILR